MFFLKISRVAAEELTWVLGALGACTSGRGSVPGRKRGLRDDLESAGEPRGREESYCLEQQGPVGTGRIAGCLLRGGAVSERKEGAEPHD